MSGRVGEWETRRDGEWESFGPVVAKEVSGE